MAGGVEQKRKAYSLKIHQESGIVEYLTLPSDPVGMNLVHRSELTGFGALTYVPRGEKSAWMAKSGFPMDTEAVHLDEQRAFAPIRESGDDYVVCRNFITGHSLRYEFSEEYFDLWLEGEMPEYDQVGLDLDVAFMDVRQDEPAEYQYQVKSPYRSEDRSLCFVYLSRPIPPGLLVTCLTPAAGWRLRYGRYYSAPPQYSLFTQPIYGLQMVSRFHSKLDPEAKPGPIRLGVRVAFPPTLKAARTFIVQKQQVPLLDAVSMGGTVGDELPFSIEGAAEKAELTSPDGKAVPVTIQPTSTGTMTGRIKLDTEGFYTLRVWNAKGRGSDMILHAGAEWPTTFKRSLDRLKPTPPFNAEGTYWAHAMCVARMLFGADEKQDAFLYDALVRINMQGLEAPKELKAYPPTSILAEMKKQNGWFVRTPIPESHVHLGKTFSPFHQYCNERVQDAFSSIQLGLFAAEAFGCDAFIDQAVRMADALIKDNMDSEGRIYRLTEDGKDVIDYTTVICPPQALVDLAVALKRKKDPRFSRIQEAVERVMSFLMKRGMFFPTEGVSPHVRWTEDGSIACTALALVYAYWYVEKRLEWLEFAGQILDYHESWCIEAPDARMHGSTNRYWETQWEGDGEGRAICAGHSWTLWRSEASFYFGLATLNARHLIQSWNGYETNRCKFFKDGRAATCFTPDYLPDRPRRFALTHDYPRGADRFLAYYPWSRIKETWFKTVCIVEGAEGSGPVALNGCLKMDKTGYVLYPHAPMFNRLILLSEKLGDKLKVATDHQFEICSKVNWVCSKAKEASLFELRCS